MIPAPNPGIYAGIPFDTYRAWDAVNQSFLKTMLSHSPAHAMHERDNPTSTAALALGSLVHAMLLEPDTVADNFIVIPECDRRTTEGKAIYAAFLARKRPSQVEVKAGEWEKAEAMVAICTNHPTATEWLADAEEREVCIVWNDAATGLRCKARLDGITQRLYGHGILDIKTTADASADSFSKSIYNYGYHMQAAFYRDALRSLELTPAEFRIIAIESSAPYQTACYELSETAIELGAVEIRKALDLYATCRESGNWPGYESQTLDLPYWAYSRKATG
jgi:methylphosphotriester-DNA--protein-cysteine methyltransferase